jgi:two-component system response regulator AtoC
MNTNKILIVDDEENMRHMLSVILTKEGYEVDVGRDGKEAMDKLKSSTFDFILADIRMPRMDGISLLKELKANKVDSTVIMMSAYGTMDTALEAMKLGAYDYITKPFKPDEVILTLKKAKEREKLRRENILLKNEVKRKHSFKNIIAKSDKMREMFATIEKISGYKTTVLITGETGTGKELVARAIHYNSLRKDRPFIPINCGAIPKDLLESELFGHEKGAFTGAIQTKKGMFEEADGGSLFLDEVGELPGLLQVKLLRVLQEEEIRRIGDTRAISIDSRVIAASAKDLALEVKKGNFRNDLFYRLNILPISIPPLRERREDIPLLIEHFIKKYNSRLKLMIEKVSKDGLSLLLDYLWPGNVRELENCIERAMVLTNSSIIEVENLPPEIKEIETPFKISSIEEEFSIKKANKMMERELIRKALEKTGGNHTRAARLLEISHRALLYKIKEYRLES